MARIHIGQKLGFAGRVRKHVDIRVPRSAGEVIFYKDDLIIEALSTTNMREIAYEQVCGWMPGTDGRI